MTTEAFLDATTDHPIDSSSVPMLRTFAEKRSSYLLNHPEIKKLPSDPVMVAPSSSSYVRLTPVYDLFTMPSDVIINEVLASNASTNRNSKGEFADWIELHNRGAEAVTLDRMYLTDDPRNARKWEFPQGTVIAPGGYLVVWADGEQKGADGLHANFKLSKGGETLSLLSEEALLSGVKFPALSDDQSYGFVDGKWRVGKPSPGKANAN